MRRGRFAICRGIGAVHIVAKPSQLSGIGNLERIGLGTVTGRGLLLSHDHLCQRQRHGTQKRHKALRGGKVYFMRVEFWVMNLV